MKRPVIFTLLGCLLGTSPALGVLNSPDAGGYLERGLLMLEDHNYSGCIDQLARIHALSPTPSQREDALYYLGRATLGLGDDEALTVLNRFLEEYPASTRRTDVMMSVGDYHSSATTTPRP